MKSEFLWSNAFTQTWKRPIFYGWWLVVITLVLNACTGSPVFGGVGVWVDSLEMHFGWTRTELSWAFSLGQLEGSIIGPIVGVLVDRIGPRNVVMAGVAIIGIGFVLFSQTQSLPMFYLSYVVIMLGASGGGWLPMMTVINNWFDKKRTMAMGVGGLGFSMGSFLLVPLLAWAVKPENVGWQDTSLTLGIIFILIAYPISRLVRNSPEEYGEIPDGLNSKKNENAKTSQLVEKAADVAYSIKQILSMPVFWLISICHGLSTMLIGTMTVHLVLALKDQGISVQTGAWIWGTTLGFSGIAQIIGGYLGDRVRKNIALCVFGCLQALGVFLATFIDSLYLAPFFVIVYGLGFGARIPLGTAIRGEYFGRKSFGKVLGLSMAPMMLMMMAGPLFAGWMHDRIGNYDSAFYILATISVIGSLGFLFAKKPEFEPGNVNSYES